MRKGKEDRNRVCPVERAGSLESVFRKLLQNPKRMLKKYVTEGKTVLDMGCGPGFFSIAMAEMVGEKGHVIAADLQEGMLAKLEAKVRGTPLKGRIILHRTSEKRIGLPAKAVKPGGVDFVLAFYMFHELPDQEDAFREISSLLRPGGILYLVEPNFHVSKDDFGQTVSMAESLGFRVLERPRVFFSRAAVLGK